MEPIKLISLDLDGTLLDSERRIPMKNHEAIQKARKNGCEIIISTGSPYHLMPHDELNGLDISYAITANGSAIYEYRTGKCIYEDSIKTEIILPILSFLLTKDMHIDMFIQGKAYCPSYTRPIVDKLDVPNARKRYILNNRIWLEDPYTYIKEQHLFIQKITMNFYPDEIGGLVDREEVKEELEKNVFLNVVSGGWSNLEITKCGVNKGCALKRICKMKHISLESTIAVGDSTNDLDIIRTAGVGVAMANSLPKLLDMADYVTGTNDECGVAEVIERFL
ncbi:phosphatase YwpJ [Lachnospiraceae bacterium]|nr:phosphatase YwpJ [Lachnospiraceae bacterium]